MFRQRHLRTSLREHSLTIANLFQRILITAERNFVFGIHTLKFGAWSNALLDQLGRPVALEFSVIQNRFCLSHGSRFLAANSIVGAVRRQAQTCPGLSQCCLGLFDAQLVILLFKLRDDLTLMNDAAEIDGNRLQTARYFHADRRVVVRRERAIYGHGFADGHFDNLGGLHRSRRRLAVRAGRLAGRGIIALASRQNRSEQQE